MSRLSWRKALKIGKTDRYSLDISNWLNGQSVASFDVTAPDGSNLTITDKLNTNGVLSCLISGAMMVGDYEIDFSYSTVDRNDCTVVRLTVIEDCDTQTNPEWSGILNGSTIIGC